MLIHFYTLYPTRCRFPIHSPTKNQHKTSIPTNAFSQASRTVRSRYRLFLAASIILEIPFFMAGMSDIFGGTNSTFP